MTPKQRRTLRIKNYLHNLRQTNKPCEVIDARDRFAKRRVEVEKERLNKRFEQIEIEALMELERLDREEQTSEKE